MADEIELNVGDVVMAAAGAKGETVDIHEMTNGEKSYGLVDTTGAVRYYVASGLRQLM